MPAKHRSDKDVHKIMELFSSGKMHFETAIDRRFPNISRIFDGTHPVVIYGAARLGKSFKTNMEKKGIEIIAFADGSQGKWGTTIEGKKVISPAELRDLYPHCPILIASLIYESEIYDALQAMGFPLIYPLSFLNYKYPEIFVSPEYANIFGSVFEQGAQYRILELYDSLEDDDSKTVLYNLLKFRLTFDKHCIRSIKSSHPQYFDPDIFHLSDDEVFFDCGAYTGDTTETFNKVTSGKFRKIYAFEPDGFNYGRLCEQARDIDPARVVPVNSGIYKETAVVRFGAAGTIDSRFSNDADSVPVPVVSIDAFTDGKEQPTYIKMDIEGGERDALSGSRRTIMNSKPKLAVSVYHNASDLWEIPLMIREINSRYRLFLRHYTFEIIDTVCYAI